MNTREKINAAIDEIFDNPGEIKAELDRIDKESTIVDSLLAARHDAGFSQRDLAKASGLSAAKICRMESGVDSGLRLGDVQKYLAGLGASLAVFVRTRHSRRRRSRSLAPA